MKMREGAFLWMYNIEPTIKSVFHQRRLNNKTLVSSRSPVLNPKPSAEQQPQENSFLCLEKLYNI